MDGYSISQTATRTGFPPSTLRFYEHAGLVRPDRTPAGYRHYDDRHLELLSFIGRAKGFGLSLEEIAELLALLDGDRCEPVQDRLRLLVESKIADAQDRIAELVAFTAELRHAAATLGSHTPDGPCDDRCGCTTQPDGATETVALTTKPVALVERPLVCTLDAADVSRRVADWQTTAAAADTTELVDGGIRLRFAPDVDVAAIAGLAAAEQGCCQFFRFVLTIDAGVVALDIVGPPDAQPLIAELIGTTA